MTTAWTAAFAILAVAVALLIIVVVGLLRRLLPLIEHLEQSEPFEGLDLGVHAGEVVDAFTVFTAQGSGLESSQLITRDSALVLVSRGCGACEELLGHMDGVKREIDGVPLLFVADDPSYALTDRFRLYGDVYFDLNRELVRSLRNRATPQAYCLSPNHRVLSTVVPGSGRDLERLVERRKGDNPDPVVNERAVPSRVEVH